MFDHSLPLACLVIDYIINAVPFARRHLAGILVFALGYILINFLVVKISGKPVYPILKWNDWASVILCIMILVFSVVLFEVFYWINRVKFGYFSNKRQ